MYELESLLAEKSVAACLTDLARDAVPYTDPNATATLFESLFERAASTEVGRLDRILISALNRTVSPEDLAQAASELVSQGKGPVNLDGKILGLLQGAFTAMVR